MLFELAAVAAGAWLVSKIFGEKEEDKIGKLLNKADNLIPMMSFDAAERNIDEAYDLCPLDQHELKKIILKKKENLFLIWGDNLVSKNNFREGLEKYDRLYKSGNREVQRNIDICNIEWGNYLAERENYSEAINKYKNVVGENYSDSFDIRNRAVQNLLVATIKYTNTIVKNNRFSEGINLLKSLKKEYNLDSQQKREVMENIDYAYRDWGVYLANEKKYKEAIDKFKSIKGEDYFNAFQLKQEVNRHIASAYNNQGLIYYKKGQYDKAEEFFSKVSCGTYPEEEKSVAFTNLTNCLYEWGKKLIEKGQEKEGFEKLELLLKRISRDEKIAQKAIELMVRVYLNRLDIRNKNQNLFNLKKAIELAGKYKNFIKLICDYSIETGLTDIEYKFVYLEGHRFFPHKFSYCKLLAEMFLINDISDRTAAEVFKKVYEKDRHWRELLLKLSLIYINDKRKKEKVIEEKVIKVLEDTWKYYMTDKILNECLASHYIKKKDFMPFEIKICKIAAENYGLKKSLIFTYIARIYENYDKPDKAKSYYKKVLALEPYNLEVLQSTGEIYLAESDYNNALGCFRKIIEYDEDKKDNKILARAYLKSGEVYKKQGNIENATENFSKAYELDPILVEALHGIGEIKGRVEDYKEAIERYDHILKLSPKKIDTRFELGKVYFHQKELDKAIKEFKTILISDEKHESSLLYLAFSCIEKGEFREAQVNLLKLKKLRPEDFQVLFHLGNTYYLENNYKEAIKVYNEALFYNRNNTKILNNLSLCHFKNGYPDKALKEQKKALETGSPVNSNFFNSGVISYHSGNYIEATEYFIKSFQRNFSRKDSYANFASICIKNGYYKKIEDFIYRLWELEYTEKVIEEKAYMGYYELQKGNGEEALHYISEVYENLTDENLKEALKPFCVEANYLVNPDLNCLSEYLWEAYEKNKDYAGYITDKLAWNIWYVEKSVDEVNPIEILSSEETGFTSEMYEEFILNKLWKNLAVLNHNKAVLLSDNVDYPDFLKVIIHNNNSLEDLHCPCQCFPLFRKKSFDLRPENYINTYGEWELTGNRHEGGMAYVEKAINRRTGETGAYKKLKTKLINETLTREKFREEAFFLASINHPNIIKVFPQTIDCENFSFIMEWMDGGSLTSKIKNRKPDLKEAFRIILEVCKGLSYFHSLGKDCIHRDLSGNNILLGLKGEVKITDFGIAKMADISQEYTVIEDKEENFDAGTIDYMAPEIFMGEEISQSADIYSLGVIMYELLSGKKPVEPEDTEADEIAWRTCICFEEPRPLRDYNDSVPEDTEAIIMKCLEKDPGERYASVKEIEEEFSKSDMIKSSGFLENREPPMLMPAEEHIIIKASSGIDIKDYINLGENWVFLSEPLEGRTAYVIKAKEKKTGLTGALKIIKPEFISNSAVCAAFLHEAGFLSTISHENIIKVYPETIDEIKKSYLMEWMDEGNLNHKIIKKDFIDINEKLSVALAVLDGIIYFHSLGKNYIHMDINPKNILLGSEGEVKITDFGIANLTENSVFSNNKLREVRGTLPYTAPEILKGNNLSQKVDQYSFGVLLYEILTGEKPLKTITPYASYFAWEHLILNKIPSAPSGIDGDISPELDRIVLKSLEKDSENRFETMKDLRKSLVKAMKKHECRV